MKSKYGTNYNLQSFNNCFFVAKVESLFYFSFFSRVHFSTLINYSANMCRTSYEPTVCNTTQNSILQFIEYNYAKITIPLLPPNIRKNNFYKITTLGGHTRRCRMVRNTMYPCNMHTRHHPHIEHHQHLQTMLHPPNSHTCMLATNTSNSYKIPYPTHAHQMKTRKPSITNISHLIKYNMTKSQ